MGLGAFVKLPYSSGQGSFLVRATDMSGDARELCVAIDVTVVIIFCTLSPSILRAFWEFHLLPLHNKRKHVTGVGSHAVNLEREVTSGPSGSKSVTQLERGGSAHASSPATALGPLLHHEDHPTFMGRRQTRSEDPKHDMSCARLVPVCSFGEPEPEASFPLTS